jgi:hypothetical protein
MVQRRQLEQPQLDDEQRMHVEEEEREVCQSRSSGGLSGRGGGRDKRRVRIVAQLFNLGVVFLAG